MCCVELNVVEEFVNFLSGFMIVQLYGVVRRRK